MNQETSTVTTEIIVCINDFHFHYLGFMQSRLSDRGRPNPEGDRIFAGIALPRQLEYVNLSICRLVMVALCKKADHYIFAL